MKIKVITLFSGYDSQCLALDRLKEQHPSFDYDLLAWSEIDKYAIQAHNLIYPQWADRNLGDVSKIEWEKYPEFKDCDLLTYSFPCTDISAAGKQQGFEQGYRVDFNQALDARLVTDEFAKLLAKVKWLENNRIRFGCDTHKQIDDCEHAIELLEHYGFHGQFFLYTMIGGKNDLEECYSRINHWRQRMLRASAQHDRCVTYPHAQPYRNPLNSHHEIPMWQKDMAQWVNKRMIFVKTDFKDFSPRKGFTCQEYFTT